MRTALAGLALGALVGWMRRPRHTPTSHWAEYPKRDLHRAGAN